MKAMDQDLAMVKPYGMYTGIGLYPEKYNSVDEIPDGSEIAVMNDATNEDVALRILEDAGLIKISDDVELATVADITENSKNLDIIEMEQAQTVTALDDMAAGMLLVYTYVCCWKRSFNLSCKRQSDGELSYGCYY